jgi:RNA polymerase sigma factor (sigma-70 family)
MDNFSLDFILSEKFKFWVTKEFKTAKGEKLILSELPNYEKFLKSKKTSNDPSLKNVLPELKYFYEEPLLEKPQEFHLFRKMNFFKMRCKYFAKKYKLKEKKEFLNLLKKHYGDYLLTRELIVKCNLRLSYQMFKHRKDFYGQNVNDLLSDCFINIIKAVDAFDYTRGIKFSTYCTWCLLNNSIRDQSSNKKFENLVATNLENKTFDNNLDLKDEEIIESFDNNESLQFDWGKIKNVLVEKNNDRDFYILTQIFGIGCEKKTLKQLSEELSLTKERIRQIKEKTIISLKKMVKTGDLKLQFERNYD